MPAALHLAPIEIALVAHAVRYRGATHYRVDLPEELREVEGHERRWFLGWDARHDVLRYAAELAEDHAEAVRVVLRWR